MYRPRLNYLSICISLTLSNIGFAEDKNTADEEKKAAATLPGPDVEKTERTKERTEDVAEEEAAEQIEVKTEEAVGDKTEVSGEATFHREASLEDEKPPVHASKETVTTKTAEGETPVDAGTSRQSEPPIWSSSPAATRCSW